MSPPAPVTVTALPAGPGLHSLRFDLFNPGPDPRSLPAFHPFVAFELAASAGGEPVVVAQPPLDLPLHASPIDLPAGGGASLTTPIRLRIAAGARPGRDGLEWAIPHGVDGLSLTASLRLPPPYDQPTQVVFAD